MPELQDCGDPTECFRLVQATSSAINTCVKNIIESSEEKSELLDKFDAFCKDVPVNNQGVKTWNPKMIEEAAEFFGNLVKNKIDAALGKGPKGDFQFPPGSNTTWSWAAFFKKYNGSCKFKVTPKQLFQNFIIPGLLEEKYGKYLNICQSLKNIRSTMCKGSGPECFNDLTGWLSINACVSDMGYTKSPYWDEVNFNAAGKKLASRLCSGIVIWDQIAPPDHPVWKDELDNAPLGCSGAVLLIIQTGDGTELILEKVFFWRNKAQQRQVYFEMAKTAQAIYKAKMLEAISLLVNIIGTAITNRNKLISNTTSELSNVVDHNELEIWALEQFFANIFGHQKLPRSPIENFVCKCITEYLWGGGGIPPECQMGNAPGGAIWFDNAANDACVQKFKDKLHPLGEQGPIGTHTVSKAEYPDMNLNIATSAVKGKGGVQCSSAEAIDFVAQGDKWLITYRFDPSLIWYPQLYQVDECHVEKIHAIMNKIVDLLNKTRAPNCGQSVLHAWAFNEMPGTAPEGEFFGWGRTIDGDGCAYTWPNESNNTNRDGVNPGDPDLQPVALPSNCSIYPNFMGQGDRFQIFINAYFIALFWKYYGDSNVNIETSKLSEKLQSVITMLNECPMFQVQC